MAFSERKNCAAFFDNAAIYHSLKTPGSGWVEENRKINGAATGNSQTHTRTRAQLNETQLLKQFSTSRRSLFVGLGELGVGEVGETKERVRDL